MNRSQLLVLFLTIILLVGGVVSVLLEKSGPFASACFLTFLILVGYAICFH